MIDTSGYKAILRVREAYLFDIGGFLTRVYAYMRTIGTVSMLTLAGYSFVDAGIVSSTIALSMFVVSPGISRLIDRRGQTKAVALFTAIAMAGLSLLIAAVELRLPLSVCLAGAVLAGTLPQASALVRTRWVFLLKRMGNTPDRPSLKAVLSYEGVLDDIGFMVGPALSVALGAAFFPACGMLAGGVFCVVGTILLVRSRGTDPGPHPSSAEEQPRKRGGVRIGARSVFLKNGVVRLLVVLMFIVGLFYGVVDTGLLGFAEDLGEPAVSSLVLVLESVASVVAGFLFGMIVFRRSPLWQLALVTVVFGVAYSTLFFVDSITTLIIFGAGASFSYAPLLITFNEACERTSPAENLTEALTWLTTGSTLGLAVGPTLGGIIVDVLGPLSAFDVSAATALAIPVLTIACLPLFKRHPNMTSENAQKP